jgi:hypothetical protein
MRKIVCALALILCAVTVFAQDFTVSGEMKTGILWNKYENQLDDPTEETMSGSKDDAGTGPGRFRLNVGYFDPDIHVGFKFRMNWEQWNSATKEPVPAWHYAFGYAKLLDRQVTLSLGRLGASPWGTGGPEMWRVLEALGTGSGIRVEVEPHAVSGLNVGFVLNQFNGTREYWYRDGKKPVPFYEYLCESIVGASYTHEWFHARTAIRFDSQTDGTNRDNDGIDGLDLVYRLEEYALGRYVQGLKLWAMGYINGIGASEQNKSLFKTQNWMFAEYAPDLFTAQIRFGLDAIKDRQKLYIKPSVYFNLFDKFIKVGASFEYTKFFFDVASNYKEDTVFDKIELRPLLQFNLGTNVVAALEYSFLREYQNYKGTEYERRGLEPVIQNQWVNLRVGVTF